MCYCKIRLSTGAIIIAVFQFLLALGTLIWIFVGNSDVYFGQKIIIIIITAIVNMLISLVLVYAAWKEEKSTRILFLRIWLSWEVAFLLYLFISLVYIALFQWEYGEGEGFRIFVLDGILLCFHCLFLYSIFNFYEKTLLKNEKPIRIVIHTEI